MLLMVPVVGVWGVFLWGRAGHWGGVRLGGRLGGAGKGGRGAFCEYGERDREMGERVDGVVGLEHEYSRLAMHACMHALGYLLRLWEWMDGLD